MGNNIACQLPECYYKSFLSGSLERPSILKNGISNFENSEKIPEREKSSYFKV